MVIGQDVDSSIRGFEFFRVFKALSDSIVSHDLLLSYNNKLISMENYTGHRSKYDGQ